jgi:DHA1 family inner membrane transport protein
MSTALSVGRESRVPLPILALALAAFAIGTTEFVIVGILPNVAGDLGVSIPAAGLLVTGYALGVAIGAPLIALLTARWPRKATLVALMAVFIAGNVLSALAPRYGWLMTGRVVASLAHGSFFGIGAVVAAGLVPAGRSAAAISLMFTGLTLATVLGVPLGTFIGQQLGWRATFWFVSACGALALMGVAWLVPRVDTAATRNLLSELKVLGRPQVLLALALTLFGFGGMFTAFTYLAPLLQDVGGFPSGAVTFVLLVFGLGLVLGNVLGGRLADWKLMPSLLGILAATALVEASLSVALASQAATVATVFLWGVAGFAMVPGLQLRVLGLASDAPSLASTLNIAAFNLGNAGGAWLGGTLIEHQWPLRAIPVAAAGVAVLALFIGVLGVVIGPGQTRR